MGNVWSCCFGIGNARARETSRRNELERSHRWAQTGVASVQSVRWNQALPQLIKYGEQIRVLYARASGARNVPISLLEHLPNVERLDLSENSLTTVPAALLYQLPRLWSLNLARNSISGFEQGKGGRPPSNLSSNESTLGRESYLTSPLQWLSLSDNRLDQVPTVFRQIGFPRLRYLNLAGNGIRSLPTDMGSMFPCLEVLILTGNQLATIDAGSIRDMRHLRQLFLDQNQLSSLPPNFFIELSALQRLELGGNRGRLAESSVAVLSEMVGFAAFDQRRRAAQDKRLAATAT
ncbi:hypothetical protein F1559_003675 [Cyanidiococcus yangmingshanensis]|uniref:Leucine-rich repeat-containing protein 40 n=1 Tax=Cyanidiococcus yangmingshanensis TaxID=2690220 RepID=A0A7J7IJU7_9RHOD|nr:hypothetical protein F1559_003675 [Cyanidiococcus yangmingshanensis]